MPSVMNDTRVLPARLYGQKEETGGHVELLLKNIRGDEWEVLAKPAKRLKVGTRVSFGDGCLSAVVTEELTHGAALSALNTKNFPRSFESLGEMPLPPTSTKNWMTVNAIKRSTLKKVALLAPTAGLHFTKELLAEIQAKGVHLVYLTPCRTRNL